MSSLSQAIELLKEKIVEASSDVRRCSQSLGSDFSIELIDWLEAQATYPQFYWQSRDGGEKVAALGQLRSFHDPAPAYAILAPDQRVWGGRSFDGHSAKNPHCLQAFFFLPQIELINRDGTWQLAANLSTNKQRTLDTLSALNHQFSPIGPISTSIRRCQHIPSESQWRNLIDQALQAMQANEFKKVVLARESEVETTEPVRAAQLLKASVAKNHHCFHFMFSLDQDHSFTGSPPERLYHRIGTHLATEALAGTIGRDEDEQSDARLSQWLMNDPKNIQENQYVVDDIVERLLDLSQKMVVSEPQLLKLRQVQHICRRIEAQLHHGIKGVQLLAALQPTAAVAGLPRTQAMQFIEGNEPFARGWYAGSIGYISQDEAQFCVAIRSALISGRNMKFYAGAGIIEGSVAEYEWQELDRKVSTLISLLDQQEIN